MSSDAAPDGVPPEPSFRDRRRDFVAGEIRRAALQLFAEASFDEVTVDDIALAAGIAPRTFFRYFASKDDVVLQFRRHLDDRSGETLAGRPTGEGAVTALRAAFIATSTVRTEPDRAVALQHGRILADAPDLRARSGHRGVEPSRIVPQLAERMGVPPTDPRPALVAVAMTAVAGEAFDCWVSDGGPGDPARPVGAALQMLERGLGSLDNVRRSRPKRTSA